MEEEILRAKRRFGIIGNSVKLHNAIRVAIQVAPTDMSVLIMGESGSGKESFSKIIHQLSNRKHGQFIAINCGAIPEGTIDSELFGHEKGSFTGANEARKGYFEVTNGGTIFLDEIGEMPLGTQARLLRVLENGEFIRVGSSKAQKTDVRVIAATNVNLLDAVKNGGFREDLYYRLSTVPILVPPLRERDQDIELIFRKFSADFSEKYRTKPLTLTEEAKEVLLKYRFPGNIRQLKNIVEQISVLELDRVISAETLMSYLPSPHSNLPALIKNNEKESNNFSERDILYKVLFEMKSDMGELKKLVLKLMSGERKGNDIIKDHPELFSEISSPADEDFERIVQNPVLISGGSNVQESSQVGHNASNYDNNKIEDILHVTESDESLSIEKKEKELIIRALKKNNNKRKYAARDLGISERTLYRKIKQYELEND